MESRKKPSKLQKATARILAGNPYMPISRAMIEAGYSKATSRHPKANFVDLKGSITAMEEYRESLRGSGLGEELIKRKLAEMIEAQKIQGSFTEPDRYVPDYQTQIKALEMIRRDLGVDVDKRLPGDLKERGRGVPLQPIPPEIVEWFHSNGYTLPILLGQDDVSVKHSESLEKNITNEINLQEVSDAELESVVQQAESN